MSLIARFLPSPLASAVTFILWLVLSRSVSPGFVVTGVVLALGVPLLTRDLRPTTVSVRRPAVVVRYVFVVLLDALVSNLQVARGLVLWRRRRPRSAFIAVPLELRDPLGLAVLAVVTTVVPGTIWSELAFDRSTLLVHVWDVDDGEAFAAHFKARYEAPLREIFE